MSQVKQYLSARYDEPRTKNALAGILKTFLSRQQIFLVNKLKDLTLLL